MTFGRGIILARLLPVQQFGLAVVIISVTAALDIFADSGIDRFIVQHRFGYRADLIRTSHSFRVIGSAIVGLAIVVTSYPVALLFHAPTLTPAIAATGGVVTLRGFIDLRYKLQQRQNRFETEMFIASCALLADLVTTAVVAAIFHSYLATLAGVYANAIVGVTVSHLTAGADYSFRPRRKLLGLVGRFSIPIYINAGMLFAAMQGDRVLIGTAFSKPQLAVYTTSCAIGQGAAALIGRMLGQLLLPLMARQGSVGARRATVNRTGLVVIGGSFLFLGAVVALSPPLSAVVYGQKYRGSVPIVAAAGIFQMIQIQQAWINAVLMANGQTWHFPKITMTRAAAFPAAMIFLALGLPILAVPLAFALGAAASLAYAFYAARQLRLVSSKLVIASLSGIAVAAVAVIWYALGVGEYLPR